MPITDDDIRRMARLARLELTDEEVGHQRAHIAELLSRFEAIRSLDLDGIEPTSHCIPLAGVVRSDEVEVSLPREAVLANAPETRDGCFIVPRIIDADAAGGLDSPQTGAPGSDDTR